MNPTPNGDYAALRDECEVALSIPFDKRSITHGDAFYEAVLRLVERDNCVCSIDWDHRCPVHGEPDDASATPYSPSDLGERR